MKATLWGETPPGGKERARRFSAPSQQGPRGALRLQHCANPMRALFMVSATGATTVHNLAYAQAARPLGVAKIFPSPRARPEFRGRRSRPVVVARRWKCWPAILKIRSASMPPRSLLSYEGVEYELVVHTLTPEQIRIYDAFIAGALPDHP